MFLFGSSFGVLASGILDMEMGILMRSLLAGAVAGVVSLIVNSIKLSMKNGEKERKEGSDLQ